MQEDRGTLKLGGEVFLTVPFMCPEHEAPIYLNRWSQEGLTNLIRDLVPIRAGDIGGSFNSRVATLDGWLTILFSFNSEKEYQVI
jgi:hypothetical protein